MNMPTYCFVRGVSIAAALAVCLAAAVREQKPEEPPPRVVTPGRAPGQPPSDAVILFDGKDMSEWALRDGSPVKCTVDAGIMLCKTGAGNIYSRKQFKRAQIHLEFLPPFMPAQKGQARGNSGVYLHGRYEVQILDSYNNPTYANGSAGALYGTAAPLVNASRPPDQWQTYDLVFRAPKCDADKVVEPGRVTLLFNGVLVLDGVAIRHRRDCPGETGPLMLQDHDYKGAPMTHMRFRNVWYRPLDE